MKKLTLIGFFLCIRVSTLLAQEDELSPDTVITELDEIIVSANRWEQNLREVANKVTTVNNQLIQLQNPQTAADLLSFSNAVFVQKSQLGGGSPMIRGFATNRVLLVVDGVRMNNAIFRSGNVQNAISLDPNAIKEAEVIFGPGSVMYGSDAIGGVMDFHTLSPQFGADRKINVFANGMTRYSSANNERTLHADANIFSRRLSFLSSVSRSVFSDLRMGSRGPVDYLRTDYVERVDGVDVVRQNASPNIQEQSGYSQWNLMHKLAWKPVDFLKINYAFHYSTTSDVPRYDRLILRNNAGQLSNAEWYYGPQKWMMNAVTIDVSKRTLLFDQVKVIGAMQRFNESRHNRSFGSARRTDRWEEVDAFSVNLDFDRRLSDRLSVFYGGEFVSNQVESTASRENINTGFVEPTSTRYPDGATWRSSAAYINIKLQPSDAWVFNASVRYTDVFTESRFDNTFFDFPFEESTISNGNINGSLGVIYSPSEKVKWYANTSTGFRSPNVDDIGKVFDSSPGTVIVPNPQLEPEVAISLETGFAAVITKGLKLDAAFYYSTIDNAIARGAFLFNGADSIDYDGVRSAVLAQQNISQIRVGGVQVALQWTISRSVQLTSNYNYQKGQERDPDTDRFFSPTHVAPAFGATHVMVKKSGWKFDAYAMYSAAISFEDLALTERQDQHLYARDLLGRPFAPSWWTLNIKGEYAITSSFVVTGGVENILDKRYRPYSSGISSPGINFILSLQFKL